MTDFFGLIDATWPAAAVHRAGPWIIREGRGGGQRVSAASVAGKWKPSDIGLAERAQAELGQPSLFLVRPGEAALDSALENEGYLVGDRVNLRAAKIGQVAREPPWLSAFTVWPPLAVFDMVWQEGGIGPARRAVMDRVTVPKTALLARADDRVSGAGFVAIHDGWAMVHAVHVRESLRRRGSAAAMLRMAAIWAMQRGAGGIALAVTEGNTAANALYASLGMEIVGNYHYRSRPARERLVLT